MTDIPAPMESESPSLLNTVPTATLPELSDTDVTHRPGQFLVQRTSIKDIYDQEIAVHGYFIKAPPGSDEKTVEDHKKADFARWIALRIARQNRYGAEYIQKLEDSDTLQKYYRASARDQNVKGIHQMLQDTDVASTVKRIEQAQREVRNEVEKRISLGQSLQLANMKPIAKPIPHELFDQHAKAYVAQGFNVFVEQSDEAINAADLVYQRLKQRAEAAREFVALGMQRPEYREGVDENTDVAVREMFVTDAITAAQAMTEFEKYQNIHLRDDGNWGRFVGYNAASFSDRMGRESLGRLKRLDELTILDSVVIESILREKKEQTLATLLTSEIVECVVFTPPLANLVLQRPLPRVMPFSELYAVYAATLRILIRSDVAPTFREVRQKRKARADKLDAAGAEPVVHGKASGDRKRSMQADYSSTECLRGYQDMRSHARSVFLSTVKRNLDDYSADGAEDRVKVFYQSLYNVAKDYCVDVLNSMEGGILLYLHEYVSPKERKTLSTPLEFPPGSLVSPDTIENVLNNIRDFTERRVTLAGAAAMVTEITYEEFEAIPPATVPATKTISLPVVAEEDINEKVDSSSPCSPTYEQMQKFLVFNVGMLRTKQQDLQTNLEMFEYELKMKHERELKRRRQSSEVGKKHNKTKTKISAPIGK